MARIWIKYLLLYIFVVLVQVLVLNQLQVSGYLNPYFYMLFILLLPVSTPRYLVLLLAFFTGFTIDFFTDTPGLHAAATTLLGYVRTPVLYLVSGRGSDISEYPSLKNNGLRWFLIYSVILVLAHHFFLFYMEVFSFTGFFRTLIRVIFSTILSVFVIVLSQFLIFRE
ncbi:MAG TPA: rod shape-determining protein MreD [Prolixibacteraceae bacterium]|nr:rod shape-determining protein MreD [Prolixibacteraceae bacterium]